MRTQCVCGRPSDAGPCDADCGACVDTDVRREAGREARARQPGNLGELDALIDTYGADTTLARLMRGPGEGR